VSGTEEYIERLRPLKAGDLGLLRLHAGKGLDESVAAFDLFTGLWWPLRRKSPRAPRRPVAWLIAKLYAFRPVEHSRGETLARQLAVCASRAETRKERIRKKFDELLLLPLERIEPAMQWALKTIASNGLKLDWVQLTDDLSIWERTSTRLKWAKEFIQEKESKRC